MGDKVEVRYLTYSELSELYNIPIGTLHSWVHTRRIPHVRLGPRMVRFDRSAVEAFLRDRVVDPADGTVSKPDGGQR
jgi:excisionase family DNA binding protein